MIVGRNCYISPDAVIGENVVIGDNNIINDDVVIGDNVLIGHNNVLGQPPILSGEENNLRHHKLVIKNDVSIGHFNTIEIGVIKDAVIRENASIGFYCYISHDVDVGKNCILFPHCMLCGRVTLEENVEVDSFVKIFNDVEIGKYSRLFHGANVFKSCASHAFIVGEHGDSLKNWVRKEAFLKKQIKR